MFRGDRIALWGVALGILVLIVYLAWADARPDYREYQSRFRALVRERLGEERARGVPSGVQQIWLPALGRVDRCTSCHAGVTWYDLQEVPAPFKAHSPEVLKRHPIEKFGCTLCHGGQGSATRLPDAHGWVPGWEDKLLDSTLSEEYRNKERWAFLQMRCNNCHRYDRSTKHADLINRAKALVQKKGCRVCHIINGRGGSVGPDLTREGEKPTEQFDYARLTGFPSEFAWQVGHLQDPKSYSPGTVMPNFGFNSDDAQSLAMLVMSWRTDHLPADYLPGTVRMDIATPEELERERLMSQGPGAFFVRKTCYICHDVSVFGIESATKIGPDLSNAAEDAPRRFGRPLDDFLRAPSGTMAVVLSRQISLTEAERSEAIRLLKQAYELYRKRAAVRPQPRDGGHTEE
jgi:cytochrome c2